MRSSTGQRVARILARAAVAAVLLLSAGPQSKAFAAAPGPVTVKAVATRGAGLPGNALPANLLVLVSDKNTGTPIAGLVAADFTLISHMSTPPALCGFSGGIVSVSSPFPGAYQIVFRPRTDLVPACTWVSQEHLGQIRVANAAVFGTDSFSLRIP